MAFKFSSTLAILILPNLLFLFSDVTTTTSSSHNQSTCTQLQAGQDGIQTIGILNNRLIVITSNQPHLLYNLSLDSLDNNATHLLLDSASSTQLEDKWSKLNEQIDQRKVTTITISDYQSDYIVIFPHDTYTPMNMFTIDENTLKPLFMPLPNISIFQSGSVISSNQNQTFYIINGAFIWWLYFRGSKSLLETNRIDLFKTFCIENIFGNPPKIRVTSGHLECLNNPYPIAWSIEAGFTDGNQFYLFNHQWVYIIDVAAFTVLLDMSVDFVQVSVDKFFVCIDSKESSPWWWISILIVLAILLIIGLVCSALFYCYVLSLYRHSNQRYMTNRNSPKKSSKIQQTSKRSTKSRKGSAIRNASTRRRKSSRRQIDSPTRKISSSGVGKVYHKRGSSSSLLKASSPIRSIATKRRSSCRKVARSSSRRIGSRSKRGSSSILKAGSSRGKQSNSSCRR